MPVAVITDSVASLPKDLLNELNIQIIPVLLNVDGKNIPEGSVKTSELLQKNVKTSAPSPGAFLTAIEQADSTEVLILTASQKLSASYSSALIAQRDAEDSKTVKAFDTQSASGGQALLVLKAAQSAKAGKKLDELLAELQQISAKLHLAGALSNTDQLLRTGRIPKIAGWTSNQLGLKPLFEIRQGEIKRLMPARNLKNAHQKILEICRRSRPPTGEKLHLAIVHSNCPEDAKALESRVRKSIEPAEVFTASFNQSLIAAAGEGVSGMAWWWE